MQCQEALRTYSLDQNNIFPWVRHCHRLLCQHTMSTYYMCLPWRTQVPQKCPVKRRRQTNTHTHTHTHPEGGGQPGFVVRAVCLAPGGACGTPRAQEAGAVRGGGGVFCVSLLCHLAWRVLRVSWVQVSSEGVEWGAGFHRAALSLARTACLFIMKAGSFKPAILYFLPLSWGSRLAGGGGVCQGRRA